MHVTIAIESPLSADAALLIDGSEAALRIHYSNDECFTFTAAQLDRPEINFFMARADGRPMGCVALCNCGDYGEVKRLFTVPHARGLGVARALMAALEAHAISARHSRIRLETGAKLTAAVALYRALGYVTRGPFGDYAAHPASLFMEKVL